MNNFTGPFQVFYRDFQNIYLTTLPKGQTVKVFFFEHYTLFCRKYFAFVEKKTVIVSVGWLAHEYFSTVISKLNCWNFLIALLAKFFPVSFAEEFPKFFYTYRKTKMLLPVTNKLQLRLQLHKLIFSINCTPMNKFILFLTRG